MGLLLEIQDAAVDGTVTLSTLLRKLRLLAARLGSEPLEDWIRYEMDGYPNEIEVPDYRKIRLNFVGDFFGPAGSRIQNAPIPQVLVEKHSKVEGISTYVCRGSIASLEGLDSDGGTLAINMDNLMLPLQEKLLDYHVLKALRAEFPATAITSIKNAVRNRVLELAVNLWKKSPEAGEMDKSQQDNGLSASQVTQVFQTTVYGAANVVGSAHQSSLTAVNVQGDAAALKAALTRAGVDPEDIADLEAAIEQDPAPDPESKAFGPSVRAWVKKMLGKAADGVWKTGIGAAGGLLEDAILRYYGLR